ncbi:hypothetical protein AC578_4037, partial [Pseudocercospora eumusae]
NVEYARELTVYDLTNNDDSDKSKEGRFDEPTRKRKRSTTPVAPPTLIPSPPWPLLPPCNDIQGERESRALMRKFRAEDKHILHRSHACNRHKTTSQNVVRTPPTLNGPQPFKEYTVRRWIHYTPAVKTRPEVETRRRRLRFLPSSKTCAREFHGVLVLLRSIFFLGNECREAS